MATISQPHWKSKN